MTLNDAIVNMLLVQFKNQLENNEVKIIENAGFLIAKNNGHFVVETVRDGEYYNREVCIKESYRGFKVIVWNGYTQTEYKFKDIAEIRLKFDFVGFLTTPVNKAYAELLRTIMYANRTDTQQKMYNLRSAKNFIKYAKDDIEKTKKKIRELQEELECDIRRQVDYEHDLAKVRKELGLAK